MTERDADFYQAHKDDPGEWGDPRPAPRSSRRRLAAMISVRFTPQQEQQIREIAAIRGVSVSRLLREAGLSQVVVPQVHPLREPSQTCSSGVAVCWDSGRVDGGTFATMGD